MSDQPSSSSAGPSPRLPQEHTTQPNTDEDEALARAIAGIIIYNTICMLTNEPMYDCVP